MISEFRVYNRYQVLRQREMDKKEQAWENELQEAMNASNSMSYIEDGIEQHQNLHDYELKSCESCSKLNIQEVGSGASDVECHPGNIKKSESLHNTTTTTSIPTYKSKASKPFYKIFKFKSNLLQPKGQSYQLHGPSSPETTEKTKSEQHNSDILRVDATNISLFCEVEKIDYIDRTPSPERASTESKVA